VNLQLHNKTAFISGSTKGIGFSTAQKLLEEGASVIINGRNQKVVDQKVSELKSKFSNDKVTGLAADFSNINEVNLLIERLPSIDILINNLGVFSPAEFLDISDQDWLKIFEINVLSGIKLSKHCFPEMKSNKWGRIVFISSASGISIPKEMIHYGTTKTAQLAISRGLAELTKGTNVTVNTIIPGPTSSDGIIGYISGLAAERKLTQQELLEDFFRSVRPTSLLQRFITVEEVANMITFISSPLASATNGAVIKVDGGIVNSII